METSSDIEALLEKYQQALDVFDAIGGDHVCGKWIFIHHGSYIGGHISRSQRR
jgi:hypothetical protein